MPKRVLPRSHVQRMHVLRKASRKGHNMAPADYPISAALWARLDLMAPASQASIYAAGLAAVDDAAQALSASTDGLAPLLFTQNRLVSHFFQVFDLGIARGIWPSSHREYHHRNKQVAKVPPLDTADDAVAWSGHILTGETERQADEAGAFLPMALPSRAEVQAGLTALEARLGPHTTLRDALTDAQQAVEALLGESGGLDQLLLDLYDDVENEYRRLPDGARHNKCREWGIIYEGDAVSDGTDGGGSSSSSSATPLELPDAPLNVVVTTGAEGAVGISWDGMPPEQQVTAFNIYRDGALLLVSGGPTTADGFPPGETVTVTVRAVNATGEGPASDPATGTAG